MARRIITVGTAQYQRCLVREGSSGSWNYSNYKIIKTQIRGRMRDSDLKSQLDGTVRVFKLLYNNPADSYLITVIRILQKQDYLIMPDRQ